MKKLTYSADDVLTQLVEKGRQIPTREELETLTKELAALHSKVKPLMEKIKFFEQQLYPDFLEDQDDQVHEVYSELCSLVFPDWSDQKWCEDFMIS